MTPLLVGFFWDLPEIEWSQYTERCDPYDPSLYVAIITFYAGGYEALGALGGELQFTSGKLAIAYRSDPKVTLLTLYSTCNVNLLCVVSRCCVRR